MKDYREALIYLLNHISVGEDYYLARRLEQTKAFAEIGLTGNLDYDLPLVALIEECIAERERRYEEMKKG